MQVTYSSLVQHCSSKIKETQKVEDENLLKVQSPSIRGEELDYSGDGNATLAQCNSEELEGVCTCVV